MYIYRGGVVYGPYFRRFARPAVLLLFRWRAAASRSLPTYRPIALPFPNGPSTLSGRIQLFYKGPRRGANASAAETPTFCYTTESKPPKKQAQRARSDTPAPGYRDANSMRGYGAMRGVGSHGYSWSSFVSEDIAYRLGLSNGGISPQGIDNRAYGFPLRCLQEHPKGVLLAIRRRKAQLSRAERHRADASGTLQRKAQPSSAERHRDRRSHAPEPPPATGATSTGSVLPALAPRRGISVYRPAANPSRRKFGPSPPPLRPLCGLGDWAARCFASRN